jgi:hypothetical protein
MVRFMQWYIRILWHFLPILLFWFKRVRWSSFVLGPARVGDIAFVRVFFARPERDRLYRKVKLGTSVGVLGGGAKL